MERLLEQRDSHISDLNEQLGKSCSRVGTLETTVRGLEDKVARLETGFHSKELEMAGWQTKLGLKEDEVSALLNEKKQAEEKVARLMQAVGELESQKQKLVTEKKSQTESFERLIESKDGELSAMQAEFSRLRERNGVLESTMIGFQEKLRGLESGMNLKEAEVVKLRQALESEADQVKVLREEKVVRDEQSERLKQALRELENQKTAWVKKEAGFVNEVDRLSGMLEEKTLALDSANAAMNTQRERCMHLESSLKLKTENLSRVQGERDTLEESLSSCRHELKALEREAGSESRKLNEKLSFVEFQLKEVTSRLSSRTQELERMSNALGNKENQLNSSSDGARELHERINNLQAAVKVSSGSIVALEKRLGEKELEMGALNEKLQSMETLVSEKERLLESFSQGKQAMEVQIDGLRHALLELETKKAGWLKREAELLKGMQDLASSHENKCSALETSMIEADALKTKCEALAKSLEMKENSLRETMNELDGCRASRENLQEMLASSRLELGSMETNKVRVEAEFGDKLAHSQHRLKEAMNELSLKSGEVLQLSKELESRELHLTAAKEEVHQLRQRNSSLDFTVQSLQVKLSKLTEDLRRSEIEDRELFNKLAAAESSLGSSRDLISKLQLKVDLGDQIAAKVEAANGKIKELETVLAQVTSFSENNEQELEVSEWALQQLELMKASRVESSIARAEREKLESEFREALSSLEHQLKNSESQLSVKLLEASQLVKELASKESQVCSLKDETQQLREKNGSLEFAVQSLQLKNSKLSEELKRTEAAGGKWYEKMVSLEAGIAESRETISGLELKVELGDQISEKMEKANAKIRELESGLNELMRFAQDKDEKLDASEWAVQQLGMVEVSKAKASLAQAEREGVQLKQQCSDLENELKLKEEELLDMESCVRELREAEVELEATKMNLVSLMERYEGLRSEHERVAASAEDFCSKFHDQMEENFRVEQEIEKVKRELASSKREAAVSGGKLAELQAELQKTQASSKLLVHQMLSLHENLLVEGKALLDLGKEDDSPNAAYRKTSALLDCMARPQLGNQRECECSGDEWRCETR